MRVLVLHAIRFLHKCRRRIRGWCWCWALPGVRGVGRNLKLLVAESAHFGRGLSFGDNCWIETVSRYKGLTYKPQLSLGNGVKMSDSVHISCALHISLGNDCLLGSNIYIGDNSHGDISSYGHPGAPPADRPLAGLKSVIIGDRVWIGDGVTILAGARVASDSVVAANSVVNLEVSRPALLAGVPARVVRYLDGADARQ